MDDVRVALSVGVRLAMYDPYSPNAFLYTIPFICVYIRYHLVGTLEKPGLTAVACHARFSGVPVP